MACTGHCSKQVAQPVHFSSRTVHLSLRKSPNSALSSSENFFSTHGQRVMITDAAGRTHLLDYEMIETPEGWQINGVSLLPAPETGV